MPYGPLIELVTGDTAPDVRFTLYDDAADQAVDLTAIAGAIVTMRFQKMGEPLTAEDIILTQVTPGGGVVEIQWGVTLVGADTGQYEGEIRIDGDGGFRRTVGTRLRFSLRDPGAPL